MDVVVDDADVLQVGRYPRSFPGDDVLDPRRPALFGSFRGDPAELDPRVDLELLEDVTYVRAHRVW